MNRIKNKNVPLFIMEIKKSLILPNGNILSRMDTYNSKQILIQKI